MFRHPTPTTTPKLQLDFLDLENFLVKVWGGGGGGGGLAQTPPPPPPLNFNLTFRTYLNQNAGNLVKWINPLKKFQCLADLDLDHQVIKMRGDNHYQQPILTLIFMSVISYPMFFKPLQQGSISWGDQMRGDNPYTNYNPNTLFLIFVISYAAFFKPIQ